MIVVLRLCLIILLASALPLRAAQLEDTSNQLQNVEQGLQTSTAKVEELTQKIADDLKAQSEISDKLIDIAATMESQQAAIQSADEKIKALETQSVTLASDLAQRQDQLSELLAGLQHLQQNPPPALVVDPDNVLQAMRGAMMFGAVVPGIRDQALDLKGKLDELQAVRDETRAEKERQQQSIAALETSKVELASLLEQKKALALTDQISLSIEKKAAVELADRAHSLKQLLAELEKVRLEEEAKKTAEAKAAADAAAKAEAERLAELAKPPLPFSETKGKLALPASGNIIKHFGEDNGLGSTLDGLALATSEHVNVISPVYGKVEFAGTFRSYGQLLILNAGEGYLVLLAGMTKISAEIGQSVKAGEPVGEMGEGPSTLALLGDEKDRAKPVIYIEFRKHDSPVDPSPWWASDKREAMR